MQITPPIRLQAQAATVPSRMEAALRYGAAYACTLIAVAAAQLRIPSDFAGLLACITLLGLPISLYLRHSELRVGPYRIPRRLLNSAVVVLTALSAAWRFPDLPLMIEHLAERDLPFFLRFSIEYPIELLMQVFLLVAVYRSLSIINDGDAVLCALASFPVLLLLIVVHRGPQVVAYFFLWALASAVLFALDHRAEARQGISGHLPSIVPGQDVKLSARSLATVMGFSLLCAGGLSYVLTSREADERSRAENWLVLLTSRLTNFAANFPDASVNAGPERQIDFTSAPALPSRRPLWKVRATAANQRPVYPLYWRLFTLARYDGSSWSQGQRNLTEEVPRTLLPRDSFTPRPGALPPGSQRAAWRAPWRESWRSAGRGMSYAQHGTAFSDYDITSHGRGLAARAAQLPGFSDFGTPRYEVAQTIWAMTLSYGFIPLLPQPHLLHLASGNVDAATPDHIYIHADDAAEVGVLEPGESARILSEVPTGPDYGISSDEPPSQKTQKPNPRAFLPVAERRFYLQLPPTLPPHCRVRQLAAREVSLVPAGLSDYARAKRLEEYVRGVGTYTLHPPEIPRGQDAADYFLFKSQRGYCTYYAGALTVLCRAAGIPARVVSGFVNSEVDEQQGVTTLYESNAHAWTEVWVPNWGWTTLDATPSDDRGNNAATWWDNWYNSVSSLSFFDSQWWRRHAMPVGVMACIVLGLVLLAFGQRQGHIAPTFIGFNWRHLTRSRAQLSDDVTRRAIFQAYGHAAKILARRFRPRAAWETPDEWLRAAENALELQNPEPLRHLTLLYVQAKYSSAPVSERANATAHDALMRLTWQRVSERGA